MGNIYLKMQCPVLSIFDNGSVHKSGRILDFFMVV